MANSRAIRLVLFRLGPVLWAAPAAAVREVISAVPPTRIPGTDRAVAGLVNLRGTLLTVVDGRRAVGLADTQGSPESILVVERGAQVFGVSVDEVLDLIEVSPEQLELGKQPADVDPRLARGEGRIGNRRFTVLDTDALLAPVVG